MAEKMKKKSYDLKICQCGTIHLTDWDKITEALDHDQNTILICGRCGENFVIGADKEPDFVDPEKECFMMYCWNYPDYENTEFTSDSFDPEIAAKNHKKPIARIIYSNGIRVPMMTGQYATDYFDGNFSDRWYPDFYNIEYQGVTVDEIMKFINKWRKDRGTVNMSRFINENPEEIIEVISRYRIKGFNWKGTKWETEYNC